MNGVTSITKLLAVAAGAVTSLMNAVIAVLDGFMRVVATVKRLSSEAVSAVEPLVPGGRTRRRNMPPLIACLA